jgi:hypothetical protein
MDAAIAFWVLLYRVASPAAASRTSSVTGELMILARKWSASF